MPTKSPWHAAGSGVHHSNTSCKIGGSIERERRRPGTGGKPLCNECVTLNAKGQ